MAKKYVAAIEMCLTNRVHISEEMVEMLTPPALDTHSHASQSPAAGGDSAGGSPVKASAPAMTAEERKDILKVRECRVHGTACMV